MQDYVLIAQNFAVLLAFAGGLLNNGILKLNNKLCVIQLQITLLTLCSSQCPHCRLPLRPHELVNCRWVGDITQQLESLQLQNNPCVSPTSALSNCSNNSTPDLYESYIFVTILSVLKPFNF